MSECFKFNDVEDILLELLLFGICQWFLLVVVVIYCLEMLIFDEFIFGVDLVVRDMFWQLMVDFLCQDKVIIFIFIYFMNEVECCDCILLMYVGKVFVSGILQELVEKCGVVSLEEVFIVYLQEAVGQSNEVEVLFVVYDIIYVLCQGFSLCCLFSYSCCEVLEL